MRVITCTPRLFGAGADGHREPDLGPRPSNLEMEEFIEPERQYSEIHEADIGAEHDDPRQHNQ